MKKFEKGKRFLTFLLVALMVVQQSSVTTLAEELAEYTQEAQNQDAEAVAETSEASEAEVSVPDSDKSHTQPAAAVERSVISTLSFFPHTLYHHHILQYQSSFVTS